VSDPISLNLDEAITADFPPPRTEKESAFLNCLAFAADIAAMDTQRIGRTGTRGADEADYDTLAAPAAKPLIIPVIAGMILLAFLPGCSSPSIHKTPPMAPPVNTAPLTNALAHATTKAIATTRPTARIVTAMEDHQDDSAPTSGFVAEWLPVARQAAAAADATLRSLANVSAAAAGVKEQADSLYDSQTAIHAAAVENEHAATHYKADAEHERNSIFGGVIGHWLWRVMWLAIGLGSLFILAKIALLCFPATGAVNAALTFTGVHPVQNVITSIFSALWSATKTLAVLAWSALKALGRTLYRFYDQVILKHVPEGSPIYAPTKPLPSPAVPLFIAVAGLSVVVNLSN
jgi:hypothetical protein